MNLLIDLGNSRLKWAYQSPASKDGRLNAGGSIDHRADAAWWEGLPDERPGSVWFCSVASPVITADLQRLCRERWQLEARQVHAVAAGCGLRNAYLRPQNLGADRWLACIAALHRGAGSVLVADAGTALTLDLVDGDGNHQGGLICPGIGAMRAALRAHTRLAVQPAQADAKQLANDSDAAIASGTLQAALAVIEATRRRHRPARLLLTGGEAGLLAPHLDADWAQAPNLVLEGLARAVTIGA